MSAGRLQPSVSNQLTVHVSGRSRSAYASLSPLLEARFFTVAAAPEFPANTGFLCSGEAWPPIFSPCFNDHCANGRVKAEVSVALLGGFWDSGKCQLQNPLVHCLLEPRMDQSWHEKNRNSLC